MWKNKKSKLYIENTNDCICCHVDVIGQLTSASLAGQLI